MKTYIGSCHCGKVRYEADAEITSVIECNCSHCQRKGLLLIFIPPSQFRLLSGENDQSEYYFNKKVIQHLFCKTCGVQSFAYGKDKEGNATVAINIRSFEDVDLKEFTQVPFNGKDW